MSNFLADWFCIVILFSFAERSYCAFRPHKF